MDKFDYQGHAASFLPEGKEWELIWNDEFDGTELDTSKWGFRLNFWGERLKTFTTKGVELDGDSHLKLHLLKDGNDYYSPHLQTGSISYDNPKDCSAWPFGKLEKPKFLHRYGYYEIRCRLPKNPGWHAAFWLQSPSNGAHPDPRRAGVECDVMENYRQHLDGKLIGGTLWRSCEKDYDGAGHFAWEYQETQDGWHYYGVDWSPEGYAFYADGRLVGRTLAPEFEHLRHVERDEVRADWVKAGSDAVNIGPVSHTEQFILVSTECHGYRGNGFTTKPGHKKGTPVSLLEEAVLPDFFEVDHVRVFDDVNLQKTLKD